MMVNSPGLHDRSSDFQRNSFAGSLNDHESYRLRKTRFLKRIKIKFRGINFKYHQRRVVSFHSHLLHMQQARILKKCPGQKTSEIKLNMLHNYFLVSENIKHTDFYFWKNLEHFEISLIKLITQFYDRIYILRTISNIFCSYTSIYQNFYEGCKTWIWFKKNCVKNENGHIESQLARLNFFFREN